ncbi:MAG: V8-like Glu-specific endopeptidase [Bacteriovoracaceae bacterium]|jgi:V8-like Glu-specific endopeptidase
MPKFKTPKYPKILLLTMFALIFSACGKQGSGEPGSATASSIIVGDLGWKEISSLSSNSAIRQAGKSVADIDLPAMGSRCTGFLISENILMTNHHCIPTSSHARGVTAVFNHVKGVSKSSHRKYDCSTFIGNNSKLDYALLKCNGFPGRTYGFVELDDSQMNRGDDIYIVQQNCDYYSDRDCDYTKKYSLGSISNVADEYTHNADTLGGSSGSPVFDKESNTVIAIHHAGLGNNGMGRGVENYAVPMSKIVPHILTNFPSVDIGDVSGDDGDDDDNTQAGDEPNDSRAKATALSGSSLTSRSAVISSSSDVDYYSVKVPSGSKVSVSISFSHSKGDLDLKVLSSTGSTLGKSASTSNTEKVDLTSASGTVYFQVFGYNGAKGDYKLSFKVTKKAVSASNDTKEGATKISLPYSRSSLSIGTSKDLDHYTFTVTRTTKVTASISFTHSSGDLELYLMSSTGKVIAKSTSTKSLEKITKTLSAGKYYVLVFGYKGAKGKYSLKVN